MGREVCFCLIVLRPTPRDPFRNTYIPHDATATATIYLRMNANVLKLNRAVAMPTTRTVALPMRANKGAVRATRKATVMSSKLSQQEKLQAALLTSAGALASPIIPSAEAATVSPSLSNLLYSVFWGTGILVAIATGLSAISSFDKIKR